MLNLILFLFLIFLFILLSMIWPPDSPWAPWWRTNKKIARKACELARITSKDIVYELGSGDGTFLTIAAKEFGARGVGIEIDPLRFYISKFHLMVNNLTCRVDIVKDSFFKQDLSKATVVFVYLVPNTLAKLKPKFLKELKPGVRVISLRYKIDLPLIEKDKIHEIYVYKI
ncbi:MAG: 50S ribosomal protein L11 methyltransferase [Actinobacteria bacterium]|nr:50S ribosomal protein L11 methyltransferase [Actinomycetota bacterium]